jgi:deoxyhypusine synthase
MARHDSSPGLRSRRLISTTRTSTLDARTSTRDARRADRLLAHIEGGGRMFWAVAGAMSPRSSASRLAPAIRAGLIHGMSVTGANLEESLFRLVAHHSYKDFPDYRYLTKNDDTKILEKRMRRVTDTSIPEDEAFRAVEKIIVPMWKNLASAASAASGTSTSTSSIQKPSEGAAYEGDPEACWLLAAARANLPIVVPGHEDSTFGNIFAGVRADGDCRPSIAKSGIEYMVDFYDRYRSSRRAPASASSRSAAASRATSRSAWCRRSSTTSRKPVKPWAYFCQISDSTTSYGSYSGATPNEKITWDKLTETRRCS